jgi:hypothetical protein
MSSKIISIISTGEKEKALTGILYSTMAKAQGWMDEVKVVLLGPSEKLAATDPQVQDALKQAMANTSPVACKFIADQQGITQKLEELGLDIQFVGDIISNHIKEGYMPMVW